MARTLEKRIIREYQTDLDIEKFIGKSTWAQHSNLVPGQFRVLENVEIYDGGNEDYLKSRRGSQFLRKTTDPIKYPTTLIPNAISWDIGAEEYAITQIGSEFFFQALLVPDDPVKILDFDGVTSFGLGDTTRADMFLDEDRLLIFHPKGNKIIEFDSGANKFKGRNMGMKRASILSVDISVAGNIKKGRYVYALEKCYQDGNGGDILCSGVNRLLSRQNLTIGGEYARTGLIENKKAVLSIAAANFFTKITFASAGYTAAIASDVTKTVVFTGSGAVGILKEFDNTNRFWWVDINSGTPLSTDTVAIPSGTGAGTTITTLDTSQQDKLWTHLKLYRTTNLLPTRDATDEEDLIEPRSTEDDLWHVATITKTEMEFSGLAAIATGTDDILPAGNKNIRAGIVNGVFQIEDNNTDDPLISLAALDYLELLPMPAGTLGTYHAERIWASQINDTAWDNGVRITDESKNNVYYSPHNKLFYKEQSRTDFFLETQKDGQEVTKLVQFERDLVVTKEDSTLRLPDGNVTLGFEVTDHTQGIIHANFGMFVPEFGLMGITSDFKDFKIYGFDHIWRSTLNGIDVAKDNRVATSLLSTSTTSMIYLNGKIMLSNGTGTVHVLHIEQKRGWSDYIYPNSFMERLLVFAGGTRGLSVGRDQHSVEIDVKDLDTDIQISDESAVQIAGRWTTHMFRSGGGRHVLEHENLSIMASLTIDLIGIPYVNEVPWPGVTVTKETLFSPGPGVELLALLKDREYKLYLMPEKLGDFLWNRMIGNFLHFEIKTTAPFVIKSHRLFCIVDEDGNAHGDFDPFQNRILSKTGPSWASLEGDIDETGVADTEINETGTQTTDISEVP